VGFVGKGRIFSEERPDLCGGRTTWHVVVFVDSVDDREHEVGRCVSLEHAHAILKRWEKETLFDAPPPPVKYSSNGVRNRKRFKKSEDPVTSTTATTN